MISHDDNFQIFWEHERNWLVTLVLMPTHEDHEDELDWVASLFGFARATGALMLAQIGIQQLPAMKLWFAFRDDEQKKRFLNFVRADGRVRSTRRDHWIRTRRSPRSPN